MSDRLSKSISMILMNTQGNSLEITAPDDDDMVSFSALDITSSIRMNFSMPFQEFMILATEARAFHDFSTMGKKKHADIPPIDEKDDEIPF